MNLQLSGRLVTIIRSLICLMFIILILRSYSAVIHNWGFDLVDPILVYFLVQSYYHLHTAQTVPKLICLPISICPGIMLELLQYLQVKIPIFPVGVFDPIDILLFIAGGTLALVIDAIALDPVKDHP